MRSIEDLERLLSASEILLERVHKACNGFPQGSNCRMFVETYHEVGPAKLKDIRATLPQFHDVCLYASYFLFAGAT